MSTVAEHRDLIKGLINDRSFTDDWIDRQINIAIKKTSSQVLLPPLETSDDVSTVAGDPYVDLPAGFGHNLFHASTARGKITVLSSMALLLAKYPLFGSDNTPGDIAHCCLAGARVAIHPVPAEITTIKLFFYGWPPVLGEDTSVDAYIPGEDHQDDIIHNWVLSRMHKKIEDGLEGPMANTRYHDNRFEKAVKAFGLTIKQGQSRPATLRETWGI
jgi:hypothetical protein